ncbi:uncharacterized protein TRIADDRAFT_19518, partial [Trichoplax adhaerens]
VRLTNTHLRNQGTVEVYVNGRWGTVCDKNWNMHNAMVVCRQLGFSKAQAATCCNKFGQSTTSFALTNVYCKGNEPGLGSCFHNGFGNANCSSGMTAGVICSINLPDIRLVGGNSSREGRVEIYRNSTWGSICGHNWNIQAANIVCKQLGYHGAQRTACCGQFGNGTGHYMLSNVHCEGNEKLITDCFNSGNGMMSTCKRPGEEAGVVYNDTAPVRLVGGKTRNEGRVEVYRFGKWGTVCDYGFDMKDANVICRQLGYEGAESWRCCAQYGNGTGQIWLSGVDCKGNEKSIAQCRHYGWGNTNHCNHFKDVGVRCKGTIPYAIKNAGVGFSIYSTFYRIINIIKIDITIYL